MKEIWRGVDIPRNTSVPVLFTYESTATLNLGQYEWQDAPSTLVPNRPITTGALYGFHSISVSANVAENDWTSNLTQNALNYPALQLYRQGDNLAPLFREPILINDFIDQQEYQFWWVATQRSDQLLAAFTAYQPPGVLLQGANLIGRAEVTLKMRIYADEIVDENFVAAFRSMYPNPQEGGSR